MTGESKRRWFEPEKTLDDGVVDVSARETTVKKRGKIRRLTVGFRSLPYKASGDASMNT